MKRKKKVKAKLSHKPVGKGAEEEETMLPPPASDESKMPLPTVKVKPAVWIRARFGDGKRYFVAAEKFADKVAQDIVVESLKHGVGMPLAKAKVKAMLDYPALQKKANETPWEEISEFAFQGHSFNVDPAEEWKICRKDILDSIDMVSE